MGLKRRALSQFPFDPRPKTFLLKRGKNVMHFHRSLLIPVQKEIWRTCTRYSYRILGLAGTCTRHSCKILGSGELVLDILAKSWDLAKNIFPEYKGNTKGIQRGKVGQNVAHLKPGRKIIFSWGAFFGIQRKYKGIGEKIFSWKNISLENILSDSFVFPLYSEKNAPQEKYFRPGFKCPSYFLCISFVS